MVSSVIVLRTTSLIPHLLALALVVQAASAYGAVPCAGSEHGHEVQAMSQMETAHDAHSAHGGHSMHHSALTESVMTEMPAESADMSCCDDEGSIACMTSGHCLSASPLLPVPDLSIDPPRNLRSLAQDAEWLPPYGAPSGPLFRPPIA